MAEAIVKHIDDPPRDTLWTFLKYDVGLEPGSRVEIDLHNRRPANNTFIMILTHEQWLDWRRIEPMSLPDNRDRPGSGSLNSYLESFWRAPLKDHLEVGFTISARKEDRYHIGILNAEQEIVELHGSVSMVNPGGRQLPLQQELVPSVLLGTAGLFFGSCLVYAVVLLVFFKRRSRTPMHFVMGAALLLKGIVLILWWLDCLQVAKTGSSSKLGQVGWELLEKVQTILELMMFLLVALGWKLLRHHLNLTEVRFALGISVISFYLGVFEVACTTQSTCSGYQLSRYILHSLCYLVVIVAMNFNLQMVHSWIVEAPASLEAGELYRKYQAYKIFRWIFLAFIIAPTVELFLKVTVMPWYALWLYVLVQQLRTWAIYVAIVIAFARLPNPSPLRIFELTREAMQSDDEEEAGDTGDLVQGRRPTAAALAIASGNGVEDVAF